MRSQAERDVILVVFAAAIYPSCHWSWLQLYLEAEQQVVQVRQARDRLPQEGRKGEREGGERHHYGSTALTLVAATALLVVL